MNGVSRAVGLVGVGVALACSVAACTPAGSRENAQVRAGASAPTRPSTSPTTPTAWTPPTVTAVPITQFGSAGARWRKAIASVSVSGDRVLVKVRRPLTPAETNAVVAAAHTTKTSLNPAVSQVLIIDADNGYLLSYHPLR